MVSSIHHSFSQPAIHSFIHPSFHSFPHQLLSQLLLLAGEGSTDSLCSLGSDSLGVQGGSESPSPGSPPPHVSTFSKPTPAFLPSPRSDLHAHRPTPRVPSSAGPRPFLPFAPQPRPTLGACGGCSFSGACRGDIFGGPGRLAGGIHQPASSVLACPSPVLICQSVGSCTRIHLYLCQARLPLSSSAC